MLSLIDKQQRRSLDEITNISFNYDVTQQQQMNQLHNLSSGSLKSKVADDEDGMDDFDELAMLCSGQFKEVESESPVDLSKLIVCNSNLILDNKDLYAADEPETSKSTSNLHEFIYYHKFIHK